MSIDSDALAAAIAALPTVQRARILDGLQSLAAAGRLDRALTALFRQQVAAGYVLFDPTSPAALAERVFAGEPPLALQWNPLRELRLDHSLLTARGIVAAAADPAALIHRDAAGKACYLCRRNIAVQTPGEIVFPLTLNDEPHFVGANFAPIAGCHFTVVVDRHRPQRYHAGILRAGFELARRTGGRYRVLFNGLAGASILAHEHMHATDAPLPVEALAIRQPDIVGEVDGVQLASPPYPLPLWLVAGDDAAAVIRLGDRLIRAWQSAAPARHDANLLLATSDAGRYRLLVLPRDLARMTAPGRSAAMGSFEAAGRIVLSHADEYPLFEHADRAQVERMLSALTPEQPPAAVLARLGFGGEGTNSYPI